MKIPYLPGRAATFAFIVHPRSEDDIIRASCLSLLRKASKDDADFMARVGTLAPGPVGEVLFGFDPFRGEIISIPCLPAEVISARGRREILRAAQVAVERGATVLGLGALTAPATAGGSWLVKHLPPGVILTNGNSYTAAVLRRNVLEAIGALELDRPARIAIVGCTGSVGNGVTRLLSGSGFDLILIGRLIAKVRELFGDLAAVAHLSEDLADVVTADVILVLTSESSARLEPNIIRTGAVVIDAAEPANISDEGIQAWRRDITVLRGGRVRIRGYSCTYDFGLQNPAETFACLAETYLFAREGLRNHSVGVASVDLSERLERVALRHGVHPSLTLGAAPLIGAGGGNAARRIN